MNLLSLPEEVIEGHILPLLKWNDLLRFRRVCKTIRDVTTSYMRVHPNLAPELEVNLEEKSFKAFLEMGIPTTKLFLKNAESGFKFFEENWETIQEFLEKYGLFVKYLRMNKLSNYLCDNELKFVETLINLEGLEADTFVDVEDVEGKVAKVVSKTSKQNPLVLPPNFGGLKTLRIGQEKGVQIGNLILYTIGYLSACPELQLVSMPFNSKLEQTEGTEAQNVNQFLREPDNAMALAFFTFVRAIQISLKRYQKVNLKTIDFLSYHDDQEDKQKLLETRGALWFLHLCLSCLENGVKMSNVGASWFNERENPRGPPGANSAELGNLVVSMVNVQPGVFPLEMNNLERITIRATSQCDTRMEPGQSRPVWPSLKVLEICVDSNVVSLLEEVEVVVNNRRVAHWTNTRKTKDLFGFFFKDVNREELVELELKFQEDKKKEDLAVPKTQDIVNACPNLKKLKIVNWPGTNKELVKLWNGLEGLEEVSLENCKQLGNVGFVGVDREDPAFLKLKNLKKLSLKGLDQMLKITDTLFSLVICHLKLTHLILKSNGPIKSVTLAGIESLLNGQFAKSIEKFPFGQWSLEGVSNEQVDNLQQKFRSSNML